MPFTTAPENQGPSRNSSSAAFPSPLRIIHPHSRTKNDFDRGEDVTAPKTKEGLYMNQSFLGLIATAGNQASLESDFSTIPLQGYSHQDITNEPALRALSQNSNRLFRSPRSSTPDGQLGDRIIRSTSDLQRPPRSRKHFEAANDLMLTSQILVRPSPEPSSARKSPLCVAQTAHDSGPETSSREHPYGTQTDDAVPTTPEVAAEDATEEGLSLSELLAQIFNLDEQEEVISEFPCILHDDQIEVKGTFYHLKNHICYYADHYVAPEKTVKGGYLLKRGRQNPKYNRYWFQLKGDALSYYENNQKDHYFPRDTIDLRGGATVQLTGITAEDHGAFSVTTPKGLYRFRAETENEAKEWVQMIQEVAFHSRHGGHAIKICLAIADIDDINIQQFVFTRSLITIRTMSNDESFAVDESFFSFLESEADGYQELMTLKYDKSKNVSSPIAGLETDLEDVALDGPGDELLFGQGLRSSATVDDPHMRTSQQLSSASNSVLLAKSQANAGKDARLSRPTSALRQTDSSTSISGILQTGKERLRQVSTLAESFRQQSQRVTTSLKTGSYTYYDKVTTMWQGKKIHYDDQEVPMHSTIAANITNDGNSFRSHFGLPESEKLKAVFYCWINRTWWYYGKMYVGTTKLCFRDLTPNPTSVRTKMILPYKEIDRAVPASGGHIWAYHGIVVVVRGHEELLFKFQKSSGRDDCLFTIMTKLEELSNEQMRPPQRKLSKDVESAQGERALLEKARDTRRRSIASSSASQSMQEPDREDFFFDDNFASILDMKPPSMNITCLTIGSRGDVQPYIALAKGLIAEGHKLTIATHKEFGPWIMEHGIDFKHVAGDPGAIMKLCVDNDMATAGFILQGLKFRNVLREIFETAWVACHGADLLIESPSTMAGLHIAEALRIPYFRAFSMPWSRTRAFPHAFAQMNQQGGGNLNALTYDVIERGLWLGTGDLINSFRKKTLKLPKTTLDQMRQDLVPFLYNLSPSVVSTPIDWGPNIHLTGYWFLDEGPKWTPPPYLLAFIDKARADGNKLVYIGFGSITLDDPETLTRSVSEAVQDAGVRCILCKGWSDKLLKDKDKDPSKPEIPLPNDSICQIKQAPHDWLFRQVDAAVHHGGAGTTGASLRAGIPTLIKPFFGDQHFFAIKVEDLGVGLRLNHINSKSLAQCLRQITTDERMKRKAKAMGERIRSENGVQTAIRHIYRDLEYAKSLIKQEPGVSKSEEKQHNEPSEKEMEDSWTLLGAESGTDSPEEQREQGYASGLGFPSTLGPAKCSGHELEPESSEVSTLTSNDDEDDNNDDDVDGTNAS